MDVVVNGPIHVSAAAGRGEPPDLDAALRTMRCGRCSSPNLRREDENLCCLMCGTRYPIVIDRTRDARPPVGEPGRRKRRPRTMASLMDTIVEELEIADGPMSSRLLASRLEIQDVERRAYGRALTDLIGRGAVEPGMAPASVMWTQPHYRLVEAPAVVAMTG